jgi:hypothetical protein
MSKLFYLHWNAEELEPRVRGLEARGHAVVSHCTPGEPPRLGDAVPDAVIISLDRLPSHGRHVAEWFWESQKRRGIPILFVGGKPDKVAPIRAFVGGKPDKVAPIRAQFLAAHFCASEEVPKKLAELLATAPAEDVDARAAGAS